MPAAIGAWRSAGDLEIDQDSLKVLKADDYLSRLYVRGNVAVSLFIAYCATQQQGDTMHSPMNCLPASGWEPMTNERVQIPTGGAPINANRVVIQKALDKDVVLYWYSRTGGRLPANTRAKRTSSSTRFGGTGATRHSYASSLQRRQGRRRNSNGHGLRAIAASFAQRAHSRLIQDTDMTRRLFLPALACMASTLGFACSRDPIKTSQKYIASGDEYAQAGKYKAAAIEYRNAVKATPERAEPHAKLAEASLHANDVETAAAEYLRAAELSPDSAQAQVRAASVFLLAGHVTEAKDRAEPGPAAGA